MNAQVNVIVLAFILHAGVEKIENRVDFCLIQFWDQKNLMTAKKENLWETDV